MANTWWVGGLHVGRQEHGHQHARRRYHHRHASSTAAATSPASLQTRRAAQAAAGRRSSRGEVASSEGELATEWVTSQLDLSDVISTSHSQLVHTGPSSYAATAAYTARTGAASTHQFRRRPVRVHPPALLHSHSHLAPFHPPGTRMARRSRRSSSSSDGSHHAPPRRCSPPPPPSPTGRPRAPGSTPTCRRARAGSSSSGRRVSRTGPRRAVRTRASSSHRSWAGSEGTSYHPRRSGRRGEEAITL